MVSTRDLWTRLDGLRQVALLLRNRWPFCSETSGPFAPERVALLPRSTHQSKEAALLAYLKVLQAIDMQAEQSALAGQPAAKPKRNLEITVKKKGWD